MIPISTLVKLAEKHVKNAPNSDWRNNGKLLLSSSPQEVPVKGYNLKGYKEKILTTATVAFFAFERPFIDDCNRSCPFIGFTLAAITIKGKTYSNAHPVIDKLDDDDFRQAANGFSHKFCPQCSSFNSVKHTSRRAGPECAIITSRCSKCDYVDQDAFD